MFENALISVNWSGTSVDAAALARSLCVSGAELTLAHVHAEVPMSPDPLVMHLRKFELRQSMRALKGAAYATQVEPTLSVGAPTVGEGLSGLAGMLGADLLVVGPVDPRTPEFSQLGGWLAQPRAGSEAVAVAKRGFASDPAALRRVGVIGDGTAGSDRGLDLARQLASALGCRLKTLETRPTSGGPRRKAIAERRMAQFSAGVDLLVTADPALALAHGVSTALLVINDPLRSGAAAPAGTLSACSTGPQLN